MTKFFRYSISAAAIFGVLLTSARAQDSTPAPAAKLVDSSLWPHPTGEGQGSAAPSGTAALERLLLMMASGAIAGAVIGSATAKGPMRTEPDLRGAQPALAAK